MIGGIVIVAMKKMQAQPMRAGGAETVIDGNYRKHKCEYDGLVCRWFAMSVVI